MATYISLGSYRSQEAYASYPGRRAAVEETMRSHGGRLIARYLTMGRYDVAVIFEAPDDLTAAQIILQAAGRVPGGVHTETLRALTEEEAQELVQRLSGTPARAPSAGGQARRTGTRRRAAG